MSLQLLNWMRASESDNGRQGFTFNDATPFQSTSERDGSKAAGSGLRGYSPTQYREAVRLAQNMITRAMKGDRYMALRVSEALTTSDFGTLFGDVIDRSVLANYAETPYSWSMYAKRKTIQDFRQAKIFRVDRGASVLDGPILQNSYGASGSGPTGLEQVTEYPMRRRVASQYTDQLYKFGARMDFAWETMINDDLDALQDTPALFGRAARRTEEERATKLYCSATGPNATFFSNGNTNILNATNLTNLNTQYGLSNNPSLSTTALQAAMVLLSNQVDLDGEPISIEGFTLVVAAGNKITANNIMHAQEIFANDQGGTVDASGDSLQRLRVTNWAKDAFQIAVNYYLPRVITTGTIGQTAWFLFANPNSGRPALQLSFLRGHEAPQLFMKSPNAIAIGEGRMGPGSGPSIGSTLVDPMQGDFDTDSISYKVRHILGGTTLDPIMAVSSTGQNA